ncbi:DUF726 domain-containing protein [Pseudomonas sp. GD03721]|nr:MULTISPECIES: DUF726 domain-containing protein [unclassified Pseudomonas]MDH1443196.1 DUF726 domain-containing protein [Pseudomonas sp. GD03722]WGG00750.1 DUF726 domain-containing protein [Pseudomonas sp. GD03721]WGG04916.1 DUF726 domain-containing protein [Pseudomonas sp. GD03919]
MTNTFNFQASPVANPNATEANIFVHGYSAGHSDEDKQLLLDKIPGQLRHYTNIFAFWPSNHYLHFDKSSLLAFGTTGLSLMLSSGLTTPMAYSSLAGSFAKDRRKNFTDARSRAERMGAVFLEQLSEHLSQNHPQIETINLIGHSLGGRLIVNSLKTFTKRQRLAINDVLLMAAAVEVSPGEAQQMRGLLQGRLINAYSKADRTLLLNWGETCLGRNEVEHFESVEMEGFGHTQYWERLPDVLNRTKFKVTIKESTVPVQKPAHITTTHAIQPKQTFAEPPMTKLDLKTPADIYQHINEELTRIIDSLGEQTNDSTLAQAKSDAHSLLAEHQIALEKQLTELQENAEWNTFTIAFYGETGAGKSTIIETLRILLQEPKKLANQQAFRELKNKYNLSEESLQNLQLVITQTDAQLDELAQKLSTTLQQYEQPHTQALAALDQASARNSALIQELGSQLQQHEQLHGGALDAVTQLQALLAERKKNASLWQKLLNLLRKMPEEIELEQATAKLSAATATLNKTASALRAEEQQAREERLALERQLHEVVAARDNASATLVAQHTEATHKQQGLVQQRQELETQLAQLLAELEKLADGEIIGDGRADFTRQTQRYDLKLNDQPFALLDVPGIEGKEGLVLSEIESAVQKAHAVFYVTNQPAPPQTGDQQRQGTLEKIKQHLGAQTEVWAIFNKKITNPKQSLTGRPLISDDEDTSLDGLNEKMREQLGKHYRGVFPLTARPAFLVSTDHFTPESKNARDRDKSLKDFDCDELLEKSRFRAFLKSLGDDLLHNGPAKITRANFNKAKEALDQTNKTLSEVQQNLATLAEKLSQEGQSAKSQLNSSFQALKKRVESCGETLIDDFASKVRNNVYSRIANDISNDAFKEALHSQLETQQEHLSRQLPNVVSVEVGKFQQAAEDILKRFAEHAKELTSSYEKLGSTQLNEKFNIKIKIDNGIKVAGILGSLIGIALAPFTGGASLWFAGASALVSFSKAIWSALSSDYKKSQQREATEKNLRSATEQLRDALRESLQKALSEMQRTIHQLDLELEAPAKQAAAQLKALDSSTHRLKTLSRQIETVGKL